ncbi:MAG TPA: branched-chain amino acid ABC transporter permease [Solirubrobacteraceae bacterium]|nr:branched-chain amino acid ABC transporter permease [Solirubrobacteraceae bacterium]
MTAADTQPETAVPNGAPQTVAPGRGRVIGAIAVAVAVFAVFPLLVTDPSTTSIAVFALVFMVAASAWNIFSGYSGYLALGHAVFFGSGGYAVALAARDWHVAGGWPVFALLPFGGLVAGLIAIPVGLIALRTRRHTFVVVTIAIFFIFQLAAINLGFTGGTSGILLPIAPFSAANYNQPFYYVALVILILTVLVSWAVRRSRFGLQLLAVRDDEDRALGLGVKTRRIKLAAFVLSAIPTGMVGGLYFYFLGQIFPQFAFDALFDVSLALMAFLGGLGTIAGPLLGALVLESLQQYLTQTYSSNGIYLIAYGVLFLVVVLVMPRGVIPGVSQWLAQRRVAARGSSEEERKAKGLDGSGFPGVAR